MTTGASPEALFILGTVKLILSGLVLAVLGWTAWHRPEARRRCAEWVAGVAWLAAGAAVAVWVGYRLLIAADAGATLAAVYAAGELAESVGLAALGFVLLRPGAGGAAALFGLGPLAELGLLLARGPSLGPPPSPGHAAVAAAIGLAAFGATWWRREPEGRRAGVALLLIGLAHVPFALALRGPAPWLAGAALHLLGLAALALAAERTSEDLFVRVFVRLNLTFIFLASLLMALAAESERAKRVEFAQREIEDLAEFLRGHVMYYLGEGRPPAEILRSDVILREVVAEFGHYRDLRVVRVGVLDEELSLAIDEDGIVTEGVPPSSADESFFEPAPTIVVADLPVYDAGEPIGRVVLEETRTSLQRGIARSILVIFAVFTSAVAVGSAIIGAIVYDASERLRRQVRRIEQTERRLLQAEKLSSLGEMVSGVAHELNNPLSVIVSRVDYLKEIVAEGAPRDEVAEELDVVARQAHRIGRIVQDLLGFARPHRLEPTSAEVSRLFDAALENTAEHLEERAIRLVRAVEPDVPRVRVDVDRLVQVLVNLINNAIEAMPGGGELRLGARAADGRVVLSVGDTGEGIREEDLKRVFDPFFTRKPGKGTGLGLSVSYGIVRDHGGHIWVESRRGEGTTFYVSLPQEEPE